LSPPAALHLCARRGAGATPPLSRAPCSPLARACRKSLKGGYGGAAGRIMARGRGRGRGGAARAPATFGGVSGGGDIFMDERAMNKLAMERAARGETADEAEMPDDEEEAEE
jgi:hypothetical protein